ncbi:Mur ligase domain-containing protein [Ichthyobacterium seriolicida]|uniref:Peptidoglycan synthetase n=1 Tax=Ichthyobacterium seriolicida TaxID=242600 RepID=A0A1J1DXR4_9FLAO|nr:Mur ligase family protein [Ichthyobacterium seriolicida]BAV94658.1 peptidoglycan synthetase [Ichthyobacterium seriolicida]
MRVHFIGIDENIICDLAIALKREGIGVTGSTDSYDELSESVSSSLEKEGILSDIHNFNKNNISKEIDYLVLATDIKSDNIEVEQANILNINTYSYCDFIYEYSKNKTRIVIAGSSQRANIISMILHVLQYNDIEIDYVLSKGVKANVSLTSHNNFILIEGDEYLSYNNSSSINAYKPNITLLSSINWEYSDTFKSLEDYLERFKALIDSITYGGCVVYNSQDNLVSGICESSTNFIKKFPYRVPEFSFKKGNYYINTFEGEVPLGIKDEFDLLNIEASRLISNQIGINDSDFYEAIIYFTV